MRQLTLAIVVFFTASPAFAQPTDPNDLFVRVVDVGAGLCCVVKMPGGFYMVYDAGNGVTRPLDGISAIIPDTEEIDLMILSHPDSDHIGAVKKLCEKYEIKRVIRTGYERLDIATWKQADKAVRCEVIQDGCHDINLRDHDMPPGATYFFGETHVTIVSGYHEPPSDWGLTDDSEKRNSISIVVRLVYKGKSILFCGDTVGREIDGPEDECIAAEKVMVERASIIFLLRAGHFISPAA